MKKFSFFMLLPLYLYSYTACAEKLRLESPAFKTHTEIPAEYTCAGVDRSPPLNWSNAPEKTQSFALVVEDPDTPNGVWTHWFIFNIPPTVTQLEAGSPLPVDAANAQNSWGGLGYRGPCPPIGAHSYIFKLYALDRRLSLSNGADKDKALHEMTGHVLERAEITGIVQKLP